MSCIEKLLFFVSTYFTDNIYLFTTKIQGILWSAADIILIFFFLKIINFIRLEALKKKIISGYIFLWISTFLTLLLPFTKTSQGFFILEAILCGIQYSILIIILIAERKDILSFLQKVLKNQKV